MRAARQTDKQTYTYADHSTSPILLGRSNENDRAVKDCKTVKGFVINDTS